MLLVCQDILPLSLSLLSGRRRLAVALLSVLLCAAGAAAEDSHAHARTRTNPGGCTVPTAKFTGRVLVEGAGNIKATAEDCRLACQ